MSTPHRWFSPPSYNDGDNAWGGQNDYALYGQGRVPIRELFVNNFNARFFGVRGDSKTDDGPALRTTLDTIRLAGGGTLHLPAGVYLVNSTIIHPVTGAGQMTGLVVGSNTRIVGDGPGATIIKFGSVANQAWLISNYQTVAPYSDTNISFENLTIDGSAGIQAGAVDSHAGLYLIGVAGVAHHNVEMIHVYGTTSGGNGPNGTPGEGMAFKLQGCDHVSYTACRVWSDRIVNTATGFSANKCNDVMYANCWAYGLKFGMGFTHWTCWSVRHVNCWSTNNGTDGFHSEVADAVLYDTCQSGGVTVAAQTALYAPGTALGSGQMGFHLFQTARALLVNCVSQKNTLHGLYVTGATGSGASIQVVGGSFSSNSGYGVYLNDAASATAIEVKGRPETGGNTLGDMRQQALGVTFGLRAFITAPAVPASTVTYTNNFGVDMTVYIITGTVTSVRVDGQQVAIGSPSTIPIVCLVRSQGTIAITYSVAPQWLWECAG